MFLQMGDSRRLGEHELAALDDGALIAHALAARDAGDEEQRLLALRIFAFGMEDRVRALVRSKLGSHGDAAIEEVAERALEQAIAGIENLRGATEEEARGFVFKIAQMRIVDFHRSGRGAVAVGAGGEGGGEGGGPELGRAEPETGAVEASIVVEEALAKLRPDHRAVVEHCVLRGHSARETAAYVASRIQGPGDDSISEQNVHQICSRFRKDLRSRLEADGGKEGVDG